MVNDIITYKQVFVSSENKPIVALIIGWIDKNLIGCDTPRIHGKFLELIKVVDGDKEWDITGCYQELRIMRLLCYNVFLSH